MPVEKAVAMDLSGREIKDIAIKRFSERLDRDCTLADNIARTGFSMKMHCDFKLGGMISAETFVWDDHTMGEVNPNEAEATVVTEEYKSPSPNGAREEHDLALPVETRDGKGQPKIDWRKKKKEPVAS
jgi:hypothetical protein